MNPFQQQRGSTTGIVKPHYETTLEITAKDDSQGIAQTIIQIPEDLAKFNLTVQVSSGLLAASSDYLPSKIVVSVHRDELQALVNGKPLAGMYVKMYQAM